MGQQWGHSSRVRGAAVPTPGRLTLYDSGMVEYKQFVIVWQGQQAATGERYLCAHCGTDVGAVSIQKGEVVVRSNGQRTGHVVKILYCSVCSEPTYFDMTGKQMPAVRFGATLKSLPEDVRKLYDEARDCSGVGAYTACVMICRKILMNLAVREGAKEGLGFVEYVDYLESNGHTPKKGKEWVDRIRKMGNEANHAIAPKSKDDAESIIHLIEMLLRFNFDLGSPAKP